MHLTKLFVLISHEGGLDADQLARRIEHSVGSWFEENRDSAIFEVRIDGTKEVTLASIDFSLEEGAPLQEATYPEEPRLPEVSTSQRAAGPKLIGDPKP